MLSQLLVVCSTGYPEAPVLSMGLRTIHELILSLLELP